MKKKIVLIVSGFLVAVSLFVGGVAFAASWGVIILPSRSELAYDSTDEASLTLYNNSTVFPFLSYNVKPEDLVESITDTDGNEVDFSKLDVSYEYVRNRERIPVTENEALNSDGFLDLEKYGEMIVTYTYKYDIKIPYQSHVITEGTIIKSAYVEGAIF